MTRLHAKVAGSVLLVLLMGLSLWGAGGCYRRERAESAANRDLFRLSDRISTLRVEDAPGGPVFQLRDGETLTPAEFAVEVERLNRRKYNGGLFFRIFDITSVSSFFWVAIGLLGQLLFTSRMLVQWWVSEKQKQSVVPTNFWWLSLSGASLLIVYFLWRVDVVGVLGQATGWLVYIRNLWFIHSRGKQVPAKAK